jgi:anthranilate phosphoribosyltransferase
LASFIVAGAGQKVAKHGNYGVSRQVASNVLEELGYQFKDNQKI